MRLVAKDAMHKNIYDIKLWKNNFLLFNPKRHYFEFLLIFEYEMQGNYEFPIKMPSTSKSYQINKIKIWN